MYIYLPFFGLPSHPDDRRALSSVPCAVYLAQLPILYIVRICQSQSPSSSPLDLVTPKYHPLWLIFAPPKQALSQAKVSLGFPTLSGSTPLYDTAALPHREGLREAWFPSSQPLAFLAMKRSRPVLGRPGAFIQRG